MELLVRPTASEVRNLLQRIKLENIERGLSLISAAGTELKFDPAHLVQNPVEQKGFVSLQSFFAHETSSRSYNGVCSTSFINKKSALFPD